MLINLPNKGLERILEKSWLSDITDVMDSVQHNVHIAKNLSDTTLIFCSTSRL
jgi:hypothetical protein